MRRVRQHGRAGGRGDVPRAASRRAGQECKELAAGASKSIPLAFAYAGATKSPGTAFSIETIGRTVQ